MFEDILKKEKEYFRFSCKEIDLIDCVPEIKMKGNLQSEMSSNVYYNGKSLGSPERINRNLNELKAHKKQINELVNFIIKNYREKICGSAVESAINILSNVKSIEYNDGSKREYKNGKIIGANGPI